MNEYFEIAYATATQRLCIFTGTGFSKAVSGDTAPSWQGLLESLCDLTENPPTLKNDLFPAGGNNSLTLEEAAQIVAIELSKSGKNIHAEIAVKINMVDLDGGNDAIADFMSNNSFRVVTTNYDKLAEKLIGEDCYSLTPGLPVPRLNARVKVYHVHGSIDSPENMVVTSDDYFKFLNSDSYFSKKLSTVLHENTVVIIGYSLGDTNLKAIINDYKGFVQRHAIATNIFFISRTKIQQQVKDYYGHCYGIRVLDELTVNEFFANLNEAMPNAKAVEKPSIHSIKKVLDGNHKFTDEYLDVEISFYEIISSVSAVGIGVDDPRVVNMLSAIIEKKNNFTNRNGAWEQYAHLASWLIHLGTLIELHGKSIEQVYLDAVLRSMQKMSRKLIFGYSWDAYAYWNNRWSTIIATNRAMIKKHIEENTDYKDALEIVRRG